MRNIQKQTEPASLTEHRCRTNADFTATYENYTESTDLREALETEQRGICCYCLQRIKPNATSMKIEHWKSQSRFPELQLEYSNMLGSCNGSEGRPSRLAHCDTKKGNRCIKLNPSNPDHSVERTVKFLGDGRVESDDQEFDTHLNDVLNLNNGYRLKENRKRVLDSFREYLRNVNPSQSDLRRELAKWNGNSSGALEPFCQVVVYYLRKKLRMA